MNASHSLSYAYDSLYCAYLKSHYPLQYYTTTFNLYDGDIDRTTKLTEELKYFGIELKQPKFRFARSGYTMDKENNTIYKGLSSIKFLNETVAEELYQLKDNQYNTFIDLLIDLENTSINSRQLSILCKVNYFSEFGKRKKLLDTIEIFNNIYGKKQFKKNKLPCKEEIFRQFAKSETEKMFKEVDTYSLCKFLESTIPNEDMTIKDIISNECEFYGSPNHVDKNINPKLCITLEVNNKYTTVITFYNIYSGITKRVKIPKKEWKKQNIEKYDLVLLNNTYQKQKVRKNSEGKWENIDGEFDWWCDDYQIINEDM